MNHGGRAATVNKHGEKKIEQIAVMAGMAQRLFQAAKADADVGLQVEPVLLLDGLRYGSFFQKYESGKRESEKHECANEHGCGDIFGRQATQTLLPIDVRTAEPQRKEATDITRSPTQG